MTINVSRDGWTDAARDRFRQLWTEGATAVAIANDLNTTEPRVWDARRRLKLPARANGNSSNGVARHDPVALAAIHAALLRGATRLEISQRFGLSIGQLAGIIFRNEWASPAKAKAISAGRQRQIRERRADRADVTAPHLPAARLRPPLHTTTHSAPVLSVDPMASHQFPAGRECQFPIGEPRVAGFRFCCERVETPGPYCQAHRRVAYRGFKFVSEDAEEPGVIFAGGKRIVTDVGRQRISEGLKARKAQAVAA